MRNIKEKIVMPRHPAFNINLVNESLANLYDILKIQQNRWKEQDKIDKINKAIKTETEKMQNQTYSHLFTELGEIPIQKTIVRATTFECMDVIFKILKHVPTETILFVNIRPKTLAAVKISKYNDASERQGSLQELTAHSSLNDDNYIRMIKDDLFKTYGKPIIKGNNKVSMMKDIQPDTRDDENNPIPANRQVAKSIVEKIKQFTNIQLDPREFMQTRNASSTRDIHKDNYLYIGGFDLGDDITVRVCRYLGTINPLYNIYHVYVRYCEHAFMLRINYSLKQIRIEAGITSGTAYTMLKDNNYLSVNDVPSNTTTSNMVNIYNTLKTLNGPDYTFLANVNGKGDQEISIANAILYKITDIIRTKELMDRGITSRSGSNMENITFENQVTKAYKTYVENEQQKAQSGTEDSENKGNEPEDDDFGL